MKMDNPNVEPQIENWVKLRHECSPLEIFIKLQHGAEEDVRTRNSLLQDNGSMEFRIFAEGNFFTVIKDVRDEFGNIHKLASWVKFSWDKNGITIKSNEDTKGQKASLTLTHDAQCRLKLNSEELTCWQFRKRFLEDLFFNF